MLFEVCGHSDEPEVEVSYHDCRPGVEVSWNFLPPTWAAKVLRGGNYCTASASHCVLVGTRGAADRGALASFADCLWNFLSSLIDE